MSDPTPPYRGPHPALVLALIGAVTGAIQSALGDNDALLLFGLVFGGPVALYLFWAFRVRWWRAVLVLALFGASWQAALRTGVALAGEYDTNPFVIGAISGLIGAALVLAGFAIALPAFRRPGSWALPLATGTAFGAALLFPSLEKDVIALLLVGWQTGLGAVLGWGVRRG
ncbi:MAG: hypothetical protein OEZ19_04355 [Paracoccaceae bacterium]|nr:hypothetical protein [Paracoccaceae bacterium]